MGREQGLSDEKLLAVALWQASGDLYDERERLALELAERMTFTDQDTDDTFYRTLSNGFSEAELVELVAICGFENFSSKFNHVFQVEEQKFCVIPPPQNESDAEG